MWVQGWGDVPGRLVVVSGPSGSGKSTLIRRALERPDVEAQLSISATSRSPRPGERDGVDYYFLTREAFAEALGRGEFLESAVYNGNHYGTPAAPVREALEAGRCVLLEIETQGAMQVRERVPTALFVFVDAPSFDALADRLRGRRTESAEQVHQRLVIARRERDQAHCYDVQIINDDLDRAVGELAGLVRRRP
jgi:guanylate kinase